MKEAHQMPRLSVCMPTVDRPGFFERALGSVTRTPSVLARGLEVIVSDGSRDDITGKVTQRLLRDWPGGSQYSRHVPPLSMVENFNSCVEHATGDWLLMLHDDDALLRGAASAILAAIERAREDEKALLFGVHIVDVGGKLKRKQGFKRNMRLGQYEALRRLLSYSSFVRFPAVVVHRSVFEEVGVFDTSVGGLTDIDMWTRVFAKFGVSCMPEMISAYTIHDAAASSGMWSRETITTLNTIFDRAVRLGVANEAVIRRWQADWFHQFILAGAYRHLRWGRPAEAKRILHLFELPTVTALGLSRRWLPVRIALNALTIAAKNSHRSIVRY